LHIQVNGETQELPDGLSLEDLVQRLSLPAARIAIELNKNVARRAEWAKTVLAEGDRVEIVHFVGGGSVNRPPLSASPLINTSLQRGDS
jgi:sulfur carrier protein